MADVAQMNLIEPETIDLDQYQDGGGSGKSFAPPDEGKYFGRLPVITDENFGATQQGFLKLKLDFDIVDAPPRTDGTPQQIKFASFSAKKYANRNGSQILDLIRACGVVPTGTSNEYLKATLKALSGQTFQFQLVWEAYNKDADENINGQANFPPDPNNPGKRLSYIVDPYDSTKRWFANAKVKYTISAINKQ